MKIFLCELFLVALLLNSCIAADNAYIPIPKLQNVLTHLVNRNVPPLESDLVYTKNEISRLTGKSNATILFAIPGLQKRFLNIFNIITNCCEYFDSQRDYLTNVNNTHTNALRVPNNILSVLFDTINDAGKLSAQMSPLISTAIDQVEDIIATFNRTGSSSGDLDVSGNVPSNLLQTLRQMVSVAGKFAATLTNGVKAVKSIQAQPKSLFATSSVGEISQIAINIIEDIANDFATLATNVQKVISSSIIENWTIEQISNNDEEFDLDVCVYNGFRFFKSLASDLTVLIDGLNLVKALLPDLTLI